MFVLYAEETRGTECVIQDGVVVLREWIKVLAESTAEEFRLQWSESVTEKLDESMTHVLRDDRDI